MVQSRRLLNHLGKARYTASALAVYQVEQSSWPQDSAPEAVKDVWPANLAEYKETSSNKRSVAVALLVAPLSVVRRASLLQGGHCSESMKFEAQKHVLKSKGLEHFSSTLLAVALGVTECTIESARGVEGIYAENVESMLCFAPSGWCI